MGQELNPAANTSEKGSGQNGVAVSSAKACGGCWHNVTVGCSTRGCSSCCGCVVGVAVNAARPQDAPTCNRWVVDRNHFSPLHLVPLVHIVTKCTDLPRHRHVRAYTKRQKVQASHEHTTRRYHPDTHLCSHWHAGHSPRSGTARGRDIAPPPCTIPCMSDEAGARCGSSAACMLQSAAMQFRWKARPQPPPPALVQRMTKRSITDSHRSHFQLLPSGGSCKGQAEGQSRRTHHVVAD